MRIGSCTNAFLLIGGMALHLADLWLSWNVEKMTVWDGEAGAQNYAMTKDGKGLPSSTPRRSTATNFRLEPERFVDEMASCIHNSNCRIYYLHFPKSGGTDVESRMFSMFPPSVSSCCGGGLVNQFRRNPSTYCLPKFSSYQVNGDQFLDEIVPKCMAFHEGSRSVLLSTYREPIQRTLSSIHQICNKNWDRRSNETREACLRCSFEQDMDYWNKNYIQTGVDEYMQLQRVANAVVPNATVLTIDTADLSYLYSRLSSSVNHTTAFQVNGGKGANRERKARCDFSFFPSAMMMRGLKVAEEVYRNLTMGFSSA